MHENFVHREKRKRIIQALGLMKQGLAMHDIAKELDVQEATIKRYLEEVQHHETKKPTTVSLQQFTNATTTLDSLFTSTLQEGFKCVRCKRYAKREAGICWESNCFMCKGCYLGLTKEELAKWQV